MPVTVTLENGNPVINVTLVGSGPAGADGFSPRVMASSITRGHRLAIQDSSGITQFDVMDGYSPSIEVSNITGGHRVTIISYNPASVQMVDVMDGQDGQGGAPGQDGAPGADGVSPTVTVSPSDTGHTVTITDANGSNTFEVADGVDGEDGDTGPAGPGVASGGTTGQYLKKKSGTDYDTEWATLPSIPSSASDVGAVASNQGSGNAGKFLVVGNDGVVTPVTMTAWSGGNY